VYVTVGSGVSVGGSAVGVLLGIAVGDASVVAVFSGGRLVGGNTVAVCGVQLAMSSTIMQITSTTIFFIQPSNGKRGLLKKETPTKHTWTRHRHYIMQTLCQFLWWDYIFVSLHGYVLT
jgi:hypothetical protein